MRIIKLIVCVAMAAFTLVSCGGPKVSENTDAKKVAELMLQMQSQSKEEALQNLDAVIEILGKYESAEDEQIAGFMKEVSKIALEHEGLSADEINAQIEAMTDAECVDTFKELCVGLALAKALK